jgi:hypothetical protein
MRLRKIAIYGWKLYNNKTVRGGKMKISTRICTGLVLGSSFLLSSSGSAGAQPFGLSQQGGSTQPVIQCLSTARGRFVFGQISDSSKDKFMLDTVTGRLWRISKSSEIGLFLSPVPYRAKEGKYSFLPDGERNTEKK